uniref:Rae1 protein homolog n=1 Tax=Oncorhynchus tshawytscha TaxID=74940 RepID=A0AAZ3SAY0_ONCTS
VPLLRRRCFVSATGISLIALGVTDKGSDVEVTLPPDDSISSGLGSVAQQMHTGHVLDICWSDDRNKVLLASCDKTAKMWDLNRNQDDDKMILMKTHVYPLARWHWIKTTNYSCIMMGSWDKTLKICAYVVYPIVVLAIAERGLPFPFHVITYCFSHASSSGTKMPAPS